MKVLNLALVILASVFSTANAAPIEATISCNCAHWEYSTNGEMKLAPSVTGESLSPEVSDAFLAELLKDRWYQSETAKYGYVSVTPTSFQSRPDYKTFLKDGTKSIDYITKRCETVYAKAVGNVACGVSITFPVNENVAKQLAR